MSNAGYHTLATVVKHNGSWVPHVGGSPQEDRSVSTCEMGKVEGRKEGCVEQKSRPRSLS